MKTTELDKLLSQWARVGVMFDIPEARQTPDLERLVLNTARHAPRMARLFTMAATWLHTYGDLIARHRLRRMIDDLDEPHQPVLGLLLDTAQADARPQRFKTITEHCPSWSGKPRPLFDSYTNNRALARRLSRRATTISRRWGLLAEPIELKIDAIRPASWVRTRNRQFLTRADFRGDLRSSILASLRYDRGAGDSELALARSTGASRAQIRQDLDNLEVSCRVRRVSTGNRRRIVLNRSAQTT